MPNPPGPEARHRMLVIERPRQPRADREANRGRAVRDRRRVHRVVSRQRSTRTRAAGVARSATQRLPAHERSAIACRSFTLDGNRLVYFAAWKRPPRPVRDPRLGGDLERELAPYRAVKEHTQVPAGRGTSPRPHPTAHGRSLVQLRQRDSDRRCCAGRSELASRGLDLVARLEVATLVVEEGVIRLAERTLFDLHDDHRVARDVEDARRCARSSTRSRP